MTISKLADFLKQLPPIQTSAKGQTKAALPPANMRVYIHEGKEAPEGVEIYDAGDFQGGHEGVQFWMATDKNAHNAVKQHGHVVDDLSDAVGGKLFESTPHVVMSKPHKEGGQVIFDGSTYFSGKTPGQAIKSFHDHTYPLRPDETLRTLVREGKVDLPKPSSFTDGKKVSPEEFSKRDILLRGVLEEGEDVLAKAILQESTLIQPRWTNENIEKPDQDPDGISGHFPIHIPAAHWSERDKVIGQNIADGKTLINQKMVDKAAQKMYDHAQESLDVRGLPEEFIVYRGHHPNDDGRESNDILSISLSPEKAELFASRRAGGGEFGTADESKAGREMEEAAPLLRAYKVRKSDILADTGSYAHNPYGEDELLIDWHSLKQRHVKSAKLPDSIWRPSTMKMLKFIRAEVDMKKSWITNPRGSADVKNKTVNKTVRKEGDGGGSFGDGGGVAFTSTNAGIFTPTHSERERKPKKKDKSGIGRLADFLTDNSPERKMTKGDTTIVDLVNWVKLEMRKGDRAGFHQQTSGETINNQPPRIDWARDKHKLKVEAENSSLEENKNPVEFDAKPDKTAAQQQKDEARRIRGLDDSENKRPNMPPSVNIQLGWESGGYNSDALSRGGDKDKKRGKVKDTHTKPTSEMVLQRILKEIEDSLP